MLTRRAALAGAVTTMTAAATVAANAQAAPAPLQAIVQLNGQSFTFDESTGTNLGDFVSTIGGFTQGCVRSVVSGCPLTVFFRPDRNATRAEVVFELGTIFSGTPANLGAYTVTIVRGGVTLAIVSVPTHYWFSRWRWQSAPRSIVSNIDTLIGQGLLPPFDRSAVSSNPAACQLTAAQPSAWTQFAAAVGHSSRRGPLMSGVSAIAALFTGAPAFAAAKKKRSTGGSTSGTGTTSGTSSGSTSTGSTTGATSPGPTSTGGTSTGTTSTGTTSPGTTSTGSTSTGTTSTGTTSPGTTSTGGTSTGTTSTGTTSPGSTSTGSGATTGTTGSSSSTLTNCSTPALGPVPPTLTTVTDYTVMGLASVTPYMPQTGERWDIGLVTEPQAQFICTEQAAPLAQVRADAEAAGTCPWHMRDENTGAPLNMQVYTGASCYWDSRVGNPWIATTSNPVTLDPAHMPGLAYLPYVLTGDPYHLEELQFQANYCWMSAPPAYRPGIGQSRAFAWYIRMLAQAARVTPASVPSWLLPQSYWAAFLTTNRTFLEANYVNAATPVCSVFRSTGDIANSRDEGPTAPGGTWVDPWQEEFLASVIGWVIAMGFTEWRTAFDWKIGSTVARTGTTSGWIRAWATPYRVILRATATSPLVGTWADAWTLTSTDRQLTYTDPSVWMDSDMTYLTYSRGALVYAAKLGTSGIAENLSWATGQLNGKGWQTPYKWRLI